MSQPIITVDGIGKAYRIGLKEERYRTFREAIVGAVKAPFRRLQKLRERTAGDDIFWALKDVSFEVQQGEVLGIIGRNGAGKSTLLKILTRITDPTEGTAHLRGRVASLLEVGTGFHPELTGRENVYLNGAILGMRKAEIDRKFDEIVAFAEIDKFLDTPVKRYSSGMYVRLAFAVAAHLEPEILLVDEVLAVGDVQFQRKCLGKMQRVSKEGRTVLFVSHNMGAVQALCSRCALLSAGGLVVNSSPEEVIASYLAYIEESAKSPLANRSLRAGAGEVRVTQIEASSPGSSTTRGLITGRPATFHFHLSRALSAFRFVFALYDQLGRLAVDFDNKNRSREDHYGDYPSEMIVCEVEEVMLVPGQYRMNTWLETNGILQDHVEGAMIIEVQQGCLRGRRIEHGARAATVIPHRWLTEKTC